MLQKLFQLNPKAKILRTFVFILLITCGGLLITGGQYYNQITDKIYEKTKIKLPDVKEIPFRLGLDLQGGTHLVYQADMKDVPDGDRVVALEGVRDVIERRVNMFGVSEPLVQTSQPNRIVVELAGIKDVNEAINMIGETPLLEFKEQMLEDREMTEEELADMEEFNRISEEKAIDVLAKVLEGEGFAALAKTNSDDQNTKDNGGDLGFVTNKTNPQIVELVKDLEVGNTTEELQKTSEGLEILKLVTKKKKTNPFKEDEIEKEVKASHILISYKDAEKSESELTKEEALNKIKEIEKEITSENFVEMAKEHSVGPSGPDGGSLGWFDRSSMVKPFSDTVFDNQKIGEVSYIVETMFGYHLILKEEERDIEEYKVSRILFRIKTKRDYINEIEWKNTELTGKQLERAIVQFDPNDNMPEVGLQFDGEGAKMFEEITERNLGKRIAIFLDSYSISAPTVNSKISGGKAVISGKFTIKEAKLLVQRLNAGALPVPIDLISQQTVGASLGEESVAASMKAGIIGLIAVVIFMILYYRFVGLIAVMSLAIYGILVLAIFKTWPGFTVSLSGLAGFILSIGMAVDANVLIFERFREELRERKPLSIAVKDAFARAWPSIRDGNISTVVTCLILYSFTTSVVKGFALTLMLGIGISMFSAIIVTRTFLEVFLGKWAEKRRWLIIGK